MGPSVENYRKYTVDLNGTPYDLCFGRGIFADTIADILRERTGNKDVMLVFDPVFSDKAVKGLRDVLERQRCKVYLYPMEAGKNNKTISEAIKIYELLEANDIPRDSTIIAIGGGVIGDLAGFVASTYFRGINLIHVPTTLTAMIDSSIGGKVAINFRKTINAIGNYYHPILNTVDLDFIETLPDRDLRAGLAEIIKCAIISDKDLFTYLDENHQAVFELRKDALVRIMSRAIEIKLDHVTGDVQEKSKRLKLNYGHTLGHAIEVSTAVLEEVYRHGEGVSLGMIGAAYIAQKHFGLDGRILGEHEGILKKYGLPVRVNAKSIGFDRDTLIKDCMTNVYKDKKRKDNRLRLILPRDIARCEVCSDVPDGLIREAFEYVIGG